MVFGVGAPALVGALLGDGVGPLVVFGFSVGALLGDLVGFTVGSGVIADAGCGSFFWLGAFVGSLGAGVGSVTGYVGEGVGFGVAVGLSVTMVAGIVSHGYTGAGVPMVGLRDGDV